jgi:hypothetical protein
VNWHSTNRAVSFDTSSHLFVFDYFDEAHFRSGVEFHIVRAHGHKFIESITASGILELRQAIWDPKQEFALNRVV